MYTFGPVTVADYGGRPIAGAVVTVTDLGTGLAVSTGPLATNVHGQVTFTASELHKAVRVTAGGASLPVVANEVIAGLAAPPAGPEGPPGPPGPPGSGTEGGVVPIPGRPGAYTISGGTP